MRCSLLLLPLMGFLQLFIGLATSFLQQQPSCRITRPKYHHHYATATSWLQQEQAAAVVDRQTAWEAKYQELVDFREKHGHLKVKYPSPLYRWMVNQRNKRASKGTHAPLSEEQIRLLDQIDFPWTPREDGLHDTWDAKYQELVDFFEEHGHVQVKFGTSLYQWAAVQRRKRAGIKPYAPLTGEQIQLLDLVDFCWSPEQDAQERLQTAWYANYLKLVDFNNKYGNLKVKYGSSLYTWMVNQRQRRRGKENHAAITEEQIRLLDEISFPWAPTGGSREIAWQTKYQELAEFYKQHGHFKKVKAPTSLYTWMVSQRQRRAGKGGFLPLTDEQIRLLNEIEFPWSPSGGTHETAWHNKYNELVDFYKKHGHLKVKGPSSLYSWMNNQRTKRRNMRRKKVKEQGVATLTKEQIQLLDEIHFSWEPRRELRAQDEEHRGGRSS
mmetsp:Transcript_44651/g.107630  ORF Transcript_44651/g.107630 Transcript_44651/m.107630 type:complete len:439 (+) Transcript_44651:169-1485(+)